MLSLNKFAGRTSRVDRSTTRTYTYAHIALTQPTCPGDFSVNDCFEENMCARAFFENGHQVLRDDLCWLAYSV